MCGVLLTYGDNHQNLSQRLIKKLYHRGPDGYGIYHGKELSIGFSRLAINDVKNGNQPHHYHDWVGAINGEIYNHTTLKKLHNLDYPGHCDTHLIAPLFALLGTDILHALDGFYSGILYNKAIHQLFTIRDYVGKKPLFLLESNHHKIITSELKIISNIDKYQIIPKGLSEVSLATGEITIIKKHQATGIPSNNLPVLLKHAVEKRLPPANMIVGSFISGGVDSSIIARLLTELTSRTKFYLLADPDSHDYYYAKKLFQYLNIDDATIIPLPSKKCLPALIEKLVYVTQSYNPSIISNGMCYYLLARAAQQDGVKVVVCGEGADEIFGGYYQFPPKKQWPILKYQLLDNMHFTELRRVDCTTMYHHIEVRLPYLDRAIYEYAQNLPYQHFFYQGHNKYILRKSFEKILPSDIIWRQKASADVGSGTRKMIVGYLNEKYNAEKSALRDIWLHHFRHHQFVDDPYFHSYPSFDEVIANRGVGHRDVS